MKRMMVKRYRFVPRHAVPFIGLYFQVILPSITYEIAIWVSLIAEQQTLSTITLETRQQTRYSNVLVGTP